MPRCISESEADWRGMTEQGLGDGPPATPSQPPSHAPRPTRDTDPVTNTPTPRSRRSQRAVNWENIDMFFYLICVYKYKCLKSWCFCFLTSLLLGIITTIYYDHSQVKAFADRFPGRLTSKDFVSNKTSPLEDSGSYTSEIKMLPKLKWYPSFLNIECSHILMHWFMISTRSMYVISTPLSLFKKKERKKEIRYVSSFSPSLTTRTWWKGRLFENT